MFQVPAPTILLEETVSSWIENDVESEFQERQDYWKQQVGSQLLQGQRKGGKVAWDLRHQPSDSKPAPDPEMPASASSPSPDDELTEQELETLEKFLASSSATEPSPPASPPDNPPDNPPDKSPDKSAAPPAITSPPVSPIDPASATAPATVGKASKSAPTFAAPPESSPAHGPMASFPNQLLSPDGKPHLMVVKCSQSGVTLAFDSACLDHLGFRCSMPIAGIFNGCTDTTQLYARPLAFIDRSAAAIRSAQEIETRYEQRLLPGWNCKDLINAMGIIEHLARPFCHPMPYYVEKHHRNLSIQCTTSTRSDGGITAQVVIPRGDLALQWLERVNGICGHEYEILASELAIICSDAWAKLAETVRHRINVWCQFLPREKFQLFLNDAEFGAHDAGLAGLVLTDKRLIYQKYHRGGAFSLQTQSSLLLSKQNDLIQLTHVDAEKRTRLIKISPADRLQLLATLGRPRFLKVVDQVE